MTRLPDWQLRFDSALTEKSSKDFEWGVHDCALFAADMVLAITGEDPARGLRAHKTSAQAVRKVKAMGGLAAIATRVLGPACHPSQARQGDIVLTSLGGPVGFAVCIGETSLAPAASGLAEFQTLDAICCWRVG